MVQVGEEKEKKRKARCNRYGLHQVLRRFCCFQVTLPAPAPPDSSIVRSARYHVVAATYLM